MKERWKIKKLTRSGVTVADVRAYRNQFKTVEEVLAYRPDRDERYARAYAAKAKKKKIAR